MALSANEKDRLGSIVRQYPGHTDREYSCMMYGHSDYHYIIGEYLEVICMSYRDKDNRKLFFYHYRGMARE